MRANEERGWGLANVKNIVTLRPLGGGMVFETEWGGRLRGLADVKNFVTLRPPTRWERSLIGGG